MRPDGTAVATARVTRAGARVPPRGWGEAGLPTHWVLLTDLAATMNLRLRLGQSRSFTRLRIAIAAAAVAVLGSPGLAPADTVTSQNWSGYAAHRAGVLFKNSSASWRQPVANCTAGSPSYSAFWVGIGGYKLNSNAVEQIGTELDCNTNGSESISAWYELVPAPTHTIRMRVSGGDLLSARIAVSGNRVTLGLLDRTDHQSFVMTRLDPGLDASSAEWIAEAPSDCTSESSCSTLPLANFGSMRFTNASATARGRMGAVSSALWNTTRILLGYFARGWTFVSDTTKSRAAPTALEDHGHAFSVDYAAATHPASGPSLRPRAVIVHLHRAAADP